MSKVVERIERWPADRFFWSVLDVPHPSAAGTRRRRGMARWEVGASDAAHEALELVLEPDLPVPIDAVHAVFARIDGARVLACAARRADLEDARGRLTVLTPSGVPACVPEEAERLCASLNLLTGTMEPPAIATRRRRRAAAACAILLASAAMVLVGASRRVGALDRTAELAADGTRGILGRFGPGMDMPAARGRLESELAQARRRATAMAQHADGPQASRTLAALLAGWPDDESVELTTLTVSGSEIVLNALSNASQTAFIGSISAPPGWRMNEPHLSAAGRAGSRLRLVMRPVDGGAAPQAEGGP